MKPSLPSLPSAQPLATTQSVFCLLDLPILVQIHGLKQQVPFYD